MAPPACPGVKGPVTRYPSRWMASAASRVARTLAIERLDLSPGRRLGARGPGHDDPAGSAGRERLLVVGIAEVDEAADQRALSDATRAEPKEIQDPRPLRRADQHRRVRSEE